MTTDPPNTGPANVQRVALHTLGCKLNQAETSTIAQRFRDRAFEVVRAGHSEQLPADVPADVVVINSCSVTNNADKECRRLIRRTLRENPAAFVIVTGCYAQLKPEVVASIDGVDLVLGSAEKLRAAELAGDCQKRATPFVEVSEIASAFAFGPAFSHLADGRVRAFLKIQDGCDYGCSFCTVPRARGASRSQALADTLEQARALVARGFHEIVLSGVNVGDYGRKSGQSLLELLEALHDVPGLRRLKIGSIEPNLLTNAIIDLAAQSDRLMPHFHVPLQSGSPAVLKLMRRRYTVDLFRERMIRIREKLPEAAIGADVIVGFPSEGEQEFAECAAFLAELPLSYLHVFTYSERDDTPAAAFPGRIGPSERRARTRVLRQLSARKRSTFEASQLGVSRPVLVECVGRDGRLEGLTDNYIRVGFHGSDSLVGAVVDVQLVEAGERLVSGRVVGAPQTTAPEGLPSFLFSGRDVP